MPLSTGFADLLIDLSAALTALGTPWYVSGAQAALIWGRPRLTTDVDATVRVGDIGTEGVVRALARHGFMLRFEGTPDFIRHTRVLPLEHTRSGLAPDLVLAGPGLEDLFLIRDTLALLEGALGQSDLRPVFEAEFARWQSGR